MLSLLALLLASPPLDPAWAVDEALRANPALRAARARAQSEDAAVAAEGWWPEPSLRATANPLPIQTKEGPAWATLGLQQSIPYGGELSARTAAARHSAEALHEALAERTLGVVRDVRRTCAALWLVAEERRINGRAKALLDRLVELGQFRLSVGRAAQTDVLLAQVELARLQNQALDLAQREITTRAALNLLLARAPEAPLPEAAPPTTSPTEAVDGLIRWMQAHHPLLRRQQARIEGARAQLRAARYVGSPRFNVGARYTWIEGSVGAVGVDVGLTLPTWGDRYSATEQAARHAVEAAEAAREDAALLASYQVVEQHVRVETALRQVRLFDAEILPLARQTIRVMEEAYSADTATFVQVLEAERALERFEVEHARARADFVARLADLEHAVGRPPPSKESP